MLKTEKVARRFVFATFFLYLCITINKLNFRKYAPHALKGQKLLAQGVWGKTCVTTVTNKYKK